MKSSKNIKVYGTLVNHTLDSTLADETHNDALMNAYQLFDGRFGDSPLPNNFQDVINKRITDITFDGGTTTIENREPVTENHYTLVVNGDTNLNGDVHITEDLHVDGDTRIDGDTYIDGDLYVTRDISGISLGDLDNVNKNADSASAGTFLKYNGSEWLPVSIALSDIFGNIGNPFEGAILKYKSGAWTLTTDDDTDTDTNRINNMLDVNTSGITNGSVLKWNSSTNKWEMGTDASGSVLPQGNDGYVLKYINGAWTAQPDLIGATLMSELLDVDTTGLAANKILKWNGTKWVVADDNSGSSSVGATALSQLSDVSIPSPADGDRLVYDSNSGKWVAQGVGNTGNIDLSLGELNNVTEQNKQNSSVLIYDSTGGTWKPAVYGSSSTITYTQLTVTFNKIITTEALGYGTMNLKDTDNTQDKLYPLANNTYLYSTSQPFTVPSGYVISSITPNSLFGSSSWNVKVFASNLPKSQVTNSSNTPYTINGHSKTYNVLNLMSGEYQVKSSDVASAQTTTSTSSRFTTIKPLSSNGNIYSYTLEPSARSIYRFVGADTSGIFAGVKINTNGEIVDSDSYESCGGFISNNGTLTSYLRIPSSTNSATYDNYLTTRYATQKWTIGNSYDYSVVMTSISRDQFLRDLYASGTTSPVQISAGAITFQFIANKDITYPNSFQATVTLAKVETQNTSIGGLSVTEGDCVTRPEGNFIYAVVPVTASDAQHIFACTVYAMPKSGAVDGNGNALQPIVGNSNYNQTYGGFIASVGDPDNYDYIKYRYISYNA